MVNGQAIALGYATVDCPYRVEVASSWEAVAARWRRCQQAAFGTPFQTAHWLSNWYQVFGKEPGIKPALVTVFDGRSGEEVLLIPLIMANERSVPDGRIRRPLDDRLQFPPDFPGRPRSVEEAGEVWRALVSALPRRRSVPPDEDAAGDQGAPQSDGLDAPYAALRAHGLHRQPAGKLGRLRSVAQEGSEEHPRSSLASTDRGDQGRISLDRAMSRPAARSWRCSTGSRSAAWKAAGFATCSTAPLTANSMNGTSSKGCPAAPR